MQLLHLCLISVNGLLTGGIGMMEISWEMLKGVGGGGEGGGRGGIQRNDMKEKKRDPNKKMRRGDNH